MPAAARQSDWTSHFSIGAAVGFNISAKFSENGMFNLPSSSLANGVYDDGYVLTDITGKHRWQYHILGLPESRPSAKHPHGPGSGDDQNDLLYDARQQFAG